MGNDESQPKMDAKKPTGGNVPHGVVLGEEELELEDAALVRGLGGTGNNDIEIA